MEKDTQEGENIAFRAKEEISGAVARRIATMRKRIGTVKSSILTVSDDLEVEDYEKLKKSLGLVEMPKPESEETTEAPKPSEASEASEASEKSD